MAGLMSRVSRRQLVRFGVLALPLTFAASSPYQAAAQVEAARIGWCRRDPILKINDKFVRVDVYSTKRILDVATGPTILRVHLPNQVDHRIWAEDEGFGKGWDIAFGSQESLKANKDGIEIQVNVFVPTPKDEILPVKVLISDPGNVKKDDQGEVVDKARDDEILESYGPADEETWTNDWISVPLVTLK
jgi:hypothetical protein